MDDLCVHTDSDELGADLCIIAGKVRSAECLFPATKKKFKIFLKTPMAHPKEGHTQSEPETLAQESTIILKKIWWKA